MNLKELFPTTDKYEETFTLRNGCPVGHLKNSLTSGPFGPVSFLDYPLIEKVSHFTKEKIPERNVHALGTGAFGHFTCTNDISKYTCANLFSEIGKKTEILVRFSGTFTEKGDSETIRDPRGFAIKFYTKEGNWDLMTINFPVFPCRDMKVGPDTIHAFKRDPNTFMWNPTLLWDFVANHPEGLHSAMFLYTDRGGTPMTWRHINGFACNTFSFLNEQKERFWVKFHLISMQGTKQFDQEQARRISGEEPNFLTKDLKLSIDEKRYPKWKLACQIMPEKEGYENPFTFDCTKVWRHKDYPLIDIGEIELNAWPNSYFTEVEQVAFSPANVVPGISYSPDKLLQGRLLVYDESQYHRIGPNFKQLKVNCPLFRVNNNYVGGNMQLDSSNSFPHYYPSYFGGPKPNPKFMEPSIKEGLGPVDYYDLPGEGTDKDYFEQPRLFWNVLSEKDKQNLCANIGESLTNVTETAISKKIIQILGLVDQTFSKTVESEFNKRSQKEYKKGKYLSEELMSELLKKP